MDIIMTAETYYLTKYHDLEDDEYIIAPPNVSLQEMYQFANAFNDYQNKELIEENYRLKETLKSHPKVIRIGDTNEFT